MKNMQESPGFQQKEKDMSRVVICPTCKREIEVRNGIMANETLSRHKAKEHK